MVPSSSSTNGTFRQLYERLRPIFDDLIGYLYLLYWWILFAFRLRVAPITAYAIAALVSLELFGVPIHVLVDHVFVGRDAWLKDVFLATLFGCAVTMVYHHHRLRKRVERHQILLASIRSVVVEGAADMIRARSRRSELDFIRQNLQALVRAIQIENTLTPTFSATVLFQAQVGGPFQILDQTPMGMHSLPNNELPELSAAGKCCEEPNSLLYIPWTKISHGLRIQADQSHLPRFRDVHIVDRAFVNGIGWSLVPIRCLACIQIPTRSKVHRYVLALNADKGNCLGELDFHALQVMAGLIGLGIHR